MDRTLLIFNHHSIIFIAWNEEQQKIKLKNLYCWQVKYKEKKKRWDELQYINYNNKYNINCIYCNTEKTITINTSWNINYDHQEDKNVFLDIFRRAIHSSFVR